MEVCMLTGHPWPCGLQLYCLVKSSKETFHSNLTVNKENKFHQSDLGLSSHSSSNHLWFGKNKYLDRCESDVKIPAADGRPSSGGTPTSHLSCFCFAVPRIRVLVQAGGCVQSVPIQLCSLRGRRARFSCPQHKQRHSSIARSFQRRQTDQLEGPPAALS